MAALCFVTHIWRLTGLIHKKSANINRFEDIVGKKVGYIGHFGKVMIDDLARQAGVGWFVDGSGLSDCQGASNQWFGGWSGGWSAAVPVVAMAQAPWRESIAKVAQSLLVHILWFTVLLVYFAAVADKPLTP